MLNILRRSRKPGLSFLAFFSLIYAAASAQQTTFQREVAGDAYAIVREPTTGRLYSVKYSELSVVQGRGFTSYYYSLPSDPSQQVRVDNYTSKLNPGQRALVLRDPGAYKMNENDPFPERPELSTFNGARVPRSIEQALAPTAPAPPTEIPSAPVAEAPARVPGANPMFASEVPSGVVPEYVNGASTEATMSALQSEARLGLATKLLGGGLGSFGTLLMIPSLVHSESMADDLAAMELNKCPVHSTWGQPGAVPVVLDHFIVKSDADEKAILQDCENESKKSGEGTDYKTNLLEQLRDQRIQNQGLLQSKAFQSTRCSIQGNKAIIQSKNEHGQTLRYAFDGGHFAYFEVQPDDGGPFLRYLSPVWQNSSVVYGAKDTRSPAKIIDEPESTIPPEVQAGVYETSNSLGSRLRCTVDCSPFQALQTIDRNKLFPPNVSKTFLNNASEVAIYALDQLRGPVGARPLPNGTISPESLCFQLGGGKKKDGELSGDGKIHRNLNAPAPPPPTQPGVI